MKTLAFLGLAAALLAAAPAAPAATPGFDARRPPDMLKVVASNGATAKLVTDKDGAPEIEARAGNLYFTLFFQECGTTQDLCKSLNYSAWWKRTDITDTQMNVWNRWTLACPGYIDRNGHPNIWFYLPLAKSQTEADVVSQVEVWMECLRDADRFMADPAGFEKLVSPQTSAPNV